MNESLPDIHRLEPRQQVLWVLVAVKNVPHSTGYSATQISEHLADQCAIAMSRQRVAAILDGERAAGPVSMSRRQRVAYFKIMRRGEDEIVHASAGAILIDPAKALSSIRAVEEVLRVLKGDIRICDTYIDSKTLDYLAQMSDARTIQVLTENVQDSGRFKRDLAAFEKEHAVPIEVRVSKPGCLHDRYVLHSDGMLLVGASLKDLAKKQSMVVALSRSFGSDVGRIFGRAWHDAARFV